MRLLALALEMLPLEIFCTLPMARVSPALLLFGALLIMYTYITTIYIYTTVYIHAEYDKLGLYQFWKGLFIYLVLLGPEI